MIGPLLPKMRTGTRAELLPGSWRATAPIARIAQSHLEERA